MLPAESEQLQKEEDDYTTSVYSGRPPHWPQTELEDPSTSAARCWKSSNTVPSALYFAVVFWGSSNWTGNTNRLMPWTHYIAFKVVWSLYCSHYTTFCLVIRGVEVILVCTRHMTDRQQEFTHYKVFHQEESRTSLSGLQTTFHTTHVNMWCAATYKKEKKNMC